MNVRGDVDYGTTIVIMDFFNPTASQEGTNEEYLKEIIESAESYYYPKLIRNEIVISADSTGRRHCVPEEKAHVMHLLMHFVERWLGRRGGFSVETF